MRKPQFIAFGRRYNFPPTTSFLKTLIRSSLRTQLSGDFFVSVHVGSFCIDSAHFQAFFGGFLKQKVLS